MDSPQGHTDFSPSTLTTPCQSWSTNILSFRDAMPVYAKELIAGGVAGGIAKTAVAPLERTKILYQTRFGNFQSVGVLKSLRCIWKTDGIQGFYRGNSASVIRIVPYAALHFMTYEEYRRWLLEIYPSACPGPTVDLLAGSLSGGTAVLMTYPLDLARTMLAYQTSPIGTTGTSLHSSGAAPAYRGLADVLTQVYKSNGIRGLYRGVGPTLFGMLPYAGFKFYIYEQLKTYLPPEYETSVYAKLACGAIAGITGQTLTYPLDVVRRQLQVQSTSAKAYRPFVGTFDGLAFIARNQGWKQMYAGLSINYMKLAPSVAIGFAVYDGMKSWLKVPPRKPRQSKAVSCA